MRKDNRGTRKLYFVEDKDIVTILFRNFGKKPDKFNPEGPRNGNFWVVLEPEKAQELLDEGFNVREKENRDGDLEYRLQVFISELYFPTIIKVCGNVKTTLDNETMATLDRDQLEKVDLVLSKGKWEFGGKTGVKAWLDKGYFTIEMDKFDAIYNFDDEEDDLPFSSEE